MGIVFIANKCLAWFLYMHVKQFPFYLHKYGCCVWFSSTCVTACLLVQLVWINFNFLFIINFRTLLYQMFHFPIQSMIKLKQQKANKNMESTCLKALYYCIGISYILQKPTWEQQTCRVHYYEAFSIEEETYTKPGIANRRCFKSFVWRLILLQVASIPQTKGKLWFRFLSENCLFFLLNMLFLGFTFDIFRN